VLVIDDAHLLGVLEFYNVAKKFKYVILLADLFLVKIPRSADELPPLFNYLNKETLQQLPCKRNMDWALSRNIQSKTFWEMDDSFHIITHANLEAERRRLMTRDGITIYDKITIKGASHSPFVVLLYPNEFITRQFMYFCTSRATERFLLLTSQRHLKIWDPKPPY